MSSSSPKSIIGGRISSISTATIKYNIASINQSDNIPSSLSTTSMISSPSLLSLTSRKSPSPSKSNMSKSLHNSFVHSNSVGSTISNNSPTKTSTIINKAVPPLSKRKKILEGFVILETSGMSLPDDVLIISLSCRDFVQVADDDLTYFTELQYLDVSENQLSLSSFQHMNKLKVLKISSNNINHLAQMHITTFRPSSSSSSSSSRSKPRSRPTSTTTTTNNNNNNKNSRGNDMGTPVLYNNADCFPHLIVLDISYNALTYRDLLLLGYLPQLKELDISGNDLNILYRNSNATTNNNNNNNNNSAINYENNRMAQSSSPSSLSPLMSVNDFNNPETETTNNSNNNDNNNISNNAYDDFDDDYYDDEDEDEEERKTNDIFTHHNNNNNTTNTTTTTNKEPQRSRPSATNRVPNLKMDGLFLTLEQITLDYNGIDNAMILVELSKLPHLIHISAAHNFLSSLPSDLIPLSVQQMDPSDAASNITTTTAFRSLRSIDLSFNYFRSPETFKPLIHTCRLTTLILYGNPCLGPSGEDSLHSYVEELEDYYKQYTNNHHHHHHHHSMRHKDILIIAEIPRVRVKKGQFMGRQAYYDNFNIQEIKILPLENKLTYVWRAEGNKILFSEAVQEAKLLIHGGDVVIENEEVKEEVVDDYTGAMVFITQNDEDNNNDNHNTSNSSNSSSNNNNNNNSGDGSNTNANSNKNYNNSKNTNDTSNNDNNNDIINNAKDLSIITT